VRGVLASLVPNNGRAYQTSAPITATQLISNNQRSKARGRAVEVFFEPERRVRRRGSLSLAPTATVLADDGR
jgi:hypothetical protein